MTENHDYATPDRGTTDWHAPLNDNFAALDVDVPVWDADANRSDYAPHAGAHFIATDTGTVYQGDGSSWVVIGSIGNAGPQLYSQPSAPSDPSTDDVWFDQSEGTLKYYDGSSWVAGSGGSDTESSSGGSDGVSSDVYIPMDDTSVSEAYDTSHGSGEGNYAIVDGDAYAGSDYLESRINADSHRGGSVFYYFPEHGEEPDEVYTRIYVRIDENWQMGDTTCKLYWAGANLDAGSGGHGGGQPTGDNGWSVRVFCRGPDDGGSVTPASYIYHMDQGGEYGEMIDWSSELNVGQWHRLDTYVKLNSVGGGTANRDGVYRAWLDGDLQDEHTDLRWRTTESIGVDRVGPGTYWGGSAVSPQDNHVHFDEHRISVGKQGL